MNSIKVGENSTSTNICFGVKNGILHRAIRVNITSYSVQAIKGILV